MTKKLNIALVTDILPDKKLAAGQVLDLIIRSADDALFEIYWLNQSHLPEVMTLPSNAVLIKTITFIRRGFGLKRIFRTLAHAMRPSIGLGLKITTTVYDKWRKLKRIFRYLVYAIRPNIGLGLKIRNTVSEKWRKLKRIFHYLVHAIRPNIGLGQKNRTTMYGIGRGAKKILRILSMGGAVGIQVAVNSLEAAIIGIRLGRRLNSKDYDIVWLVLQGELLAITYFALTLVVNKKIILHQWDPIGWWAHNNGYGTMVANGLERLVHVLEKKAYVNLVPSYAWSDELTSRGCSSIRIDNFFKADESEKKPIIKPANTGKLNVVFIGNPYAHAELLQLIKQTRDAAIFLEKHLVLHYFGCFSLNCQIDGISIIQYPHMDRDDLIERIRTFDLALLPYPTEPKYSQASQYSFPSKSKIYLAASLPILSLCALNSSPHSFYKKHYESYYFNILETGDLKNFLGRAMSSSHEDIRERLSLADSLITKHFSKQAEFGPLHSMIRKTKNDSHGHRSY